MDAKPDITELLSFLKGRVDVRTVILLGIFLLLLVYTLYFARDFFMPVVIALLLNFLLRPVIRFLKAFYIPESFGAAIVLTVFLGVAGYGAVQLAEPAAEWMGKAPRSLGRIERKIDHLRKPVQQVTKAAEQVEKIAGMNGSGKTQRVEIKRFSLTDTLLTGTKSLLVDAVVTVILLYFLLASGDLFLRKLIRVLPKLKDKKRAVEIAKSTELHVSNYLLTITLINIGLGSLIGFAMYLLKVPNAFLWGVMAGLLNFIPYLGAIIGVGVVALVATLTFDKFSYALLPPLVYGGLTTFEAYLVTPMVLGRRFTLNPVAIFVSLIFWGWLWGIPGALLAVPLLATLKIFCTHIEPLAPIGEFLGK